MKESLAIECDVIPAIALFSVAGEATGKDI
jgi:hypothetical protein